MATEIIIINRAAVLRRAHAIARNAKEAAAQKLLAESVTVIAGRLTYLRSIEECRRATPYNLAEGMRQAWREAKHGEQSAPTTKATTLTVGTGRAGSAVTPLRRLRGLRMVRALHMLAAAGRWIGTRFIPSRAA